MGKRQSSFIVPSSEVSRNFDNSTFDSVKTVADNIVDVVAAGSNISDIHALALLDLDSIGAVAQYINEIVTVSQNQDGIVMTADDLALGANSNILNAKANAESAAQNAVTAQQAANSITNDATSSALSALEVAASKLTTVAYAVTPEDVQVKSYSVVNGKIVETQTTDYSALHYRKKAEQSAIDNASSISTLQDSINLKNVGGKIVDNLGSDVVVDISTRFKFLTNTQRSTPERWMVGVNYNDEIVFWGYENNNVSGSTQEYGANQGLRIIPQANEKLVAGIKVKEIKCVAWSVYVLYEDGDLYVLGYNAYGQLGTGNTANATQLTKVLTNVVKVETSSHGYHQNQVAVLAICIDPLTGDSTVWGTGKNLSGELARGNNTDGMTTFEKCIFTPDFITGTDQPVDIFVCGVGRISTYVLTNTGKVFAAGWNGDGALGLGDTNTRNIFTLVTGVLATEQVVEMVVGGGTKGGINVYYRHSVIVRTASGKLFSWGYNGEGELGIGSRISKTIPIEIQWDATTNGSVVELITSRGSWTNYYALTDTGKLFGWGYNNYGSLGLGHTTISISSPTLIHSDVRKAYTLCGGSIYCYHHGIVILTNSGEIFASGQNGGGVIGDNTITDTGGVLRQVLAPFTADQVKSISVGGYGSANAAYYLLKDGRVYATGENTYKNVAVYQTGANQPVPCLIGV